MTFRFLLTLAVLAAPFRSRPRGRHAVGRDGLVPFAFPTDDNGRRLVPIQRRHGGPHTVAIVLGLLAAETTQEVIA